MLVVTPREDDVDDEGDVSGGGKDFGGRAMRKAMDDKFKDLDALLKKRVLKSLIEMGNDTGNRLDQLEHTTMAITETLKRDS